MDGALALLQIKTFLITDYPDMILRIISIIEGALSTQQASFRGAASYRGAASCRGAALTLTLTAISLSGVYNGGFKPPRKAHH